MSSPPPLDTDLLVDRVREARRLGKRPKLSVHAVALVREATSIPAPPREYAPDPSGETP